MEGVYRIKTSADEHGVFRVLVEVLNTDRRPNTRIWGVKVSVSPGRFGVDEAWSIRLRSDAGEGEIGKLLFVPLDKGVNRLEIPVMHSGGATYPDLDPQGRVFDEIVRDVQATLVARDLVPGAGGRRPKGPRTQAAGS